MDNKVIRYKFTDLSTIGDWYIDNAFFCYTLELPFGDGVNIHNKNCILPGTYEIILDYSPHHKRMWPHILNVPGREDIRVDVANQPSQILGCVAVGLSKGIDFIGQSQAAWDILFSKLEEALKAGKVFITIS